VILALALPSPSIDMLLGSAFRSPLVGLDIGSSALKAVVLRRGRAGWSLVAAGEAPVPDASPDGTTDPLAVTEAASSLFDSLKLRRARVATALSGHAVIVKRLSLPAMTQAELGDAIPWEAEQYIPFDLSEVQLDYQVVHEGGAADAAKNTLDVLLVAAKRERVDDRALVVAQTGRRPVVIDIEAFALANAYQMNYPERTDPLSALVHIGQRVTIVCLLERGEPVFTRDISIGGQLHLDAVTREFAATGMDALAARRIVRGQFPADVNPDHVASVLRHASEQLVMEVRNTIDFYRATAPVEKLSRIVVSGGAYQAVGIVDLLASEFGAPVDVFDPFRRVTRPNRAIGAEMTGPAYAVAVGLAMRQEGDR
jgi:type IV pilus assembly protein PilM